MNIKSTGTIALSLLGLGTSSILLTSPAIAAATNVGIEFESSPTLNQTTLVQNWVNREEIYKDTSTKYKSAHCNSDEQSDHIPSDQYGPTEFVSSRDVTPYKSGKPRTKAFFRSATMPPAEGLRVLIRNQSLVGNKTPYADRKYDESNKSEKFYVSPESTHKGRYLAIQPGENRMSYEIRRGQQVIEAGEFVVNLPIQDQFITDTITREPSVIEIPCVKKDPQQRRQQERDRGRHHVRRHHVRRHH